MGRNDRVDTQLEKAINERREALQQHVVQERIRRIYSADRDDKNLSIRHPMSNAHKFKFWVAALGKLKNMLTC